jgi:hypothetical protein
MIVYKVTWLDTNTGASRSMQGYATDIEGARREEEKAMRLLQKRNPALTLHSVEELEKATVSA